MPVTRREPTLADVARESGLSVTTVSRALNNRGYLGEETKAKVAQAIAKLGYRPNQAARSLQGKATPTVGLIVPTLSLPFFGELAAHIESVLASYSYHILVCNSMGRSERERDYLDLLLGHRVDGIISGAHNEDLAEYAMIRLPIVTIDRQLAAHIPNIRANNREGGRLAAQYLLDSGSRRPALLTSRLGAHNERETGYRAAVTAAGIEPVMGAVEFHTPAMQREEWISRWLEDVVLSRGIDGIFATDDLTAASVLEWAQQAGIKVPQQLKIIGFDGTTALRRALPGLATIKQPIADIAQVAVATLMAQMQATETEIASPPELPVELIPGRTV
ncbi:MAG: LacI family DNA-binding transcriptional regulator [Propionibacteriaceae bacterium]